MIKSKERFSIDHWRRYLVGKGFGGAYAVYSLRRPSIEGYTICKLVIDSNKKKRVLYRGL